MPKFDKIDVKGILSSNKEFGMKIFEKLLIKSNDLPHIFLTEEQNLIYSMQEDFPEILSISSIGQTW